MELKDQILEKIIEAAATVFRKEPGELGAETRFVEDLGAKSANIVQIIVILMDAFDVEIPYLPFKRNKTFGDAAAHVAELCEY